MAGTVVAMDPDPGPARLPGVVVPGPTGWPAVVELFLSQKRGNTLTAYRTDLRQFNAWASAHDVQPLSITRMQLSGYRAHLEALDLAPASVARKLTALSGAFRTAVAEEVMNRHPMTFLERPEVPDESQALGMDRAELLAFFAAARADTEAVAWPLAQLLGLNGLRVSEVCAADVAGLTRVQGHRVLRVFRKGAKDRKVALAEPTATAIDGYLAGRRRGPLLLNQRRGGIRLSRHSAARIVGRCAATAGLPDGITPHSLRHTYVTLCREAGVPLQEVQDSADHADPRTTQRYDRARRSLDRAPTYTLVDYLAGRVGPGGADPQGRLFDA